ncbi:MAG: carbohydrate porin [Armatimonadetes bacterium]|nr:carbohydrate porin [Armatimonadota bacterium]
MRNALVDALTAGALTALLGGALAAGPALAASAPGANTAAPPAQTGTAPPAPAAPGGQEATGTAAPSGGEQWWNVHGQNTDIVQGDAGFPAKYSGPNSLSPRSQTQHTVTADLYAGARLSPGTEAHLDFQMWQGFGLQGTLGVENFPDADAYKLGTASPNFTFARLFVRRTIGLGGEKEDVADGPLTLAGRQDVRRVTITAGRFAMTDIFDLNSYAGDPHTQFMSWGLVANLAWDYAADAVGFTTGVSVEYNQPKWTLRYGVFQMPAVPNSFTAEDQLLMYPARGADGPPLRSWSMTSEYERRYNVRSHPGVVRLLAFLNQARMARYQDEVALLNAGADPTAARAYRDRYGFGLNWEQEVAGGVGVFSRLGWNDGQEEPWNYTDVNVTGSLGVSVNGARWHRPGDTVGLAGVVSGASGANQAFLKAGGTGILDGDGALNYGPESVVETYYNAALWKTVQGALDYQFVSNPAFNQDRGPVSIFGVRLHASF